MSDPTLKERVTELKAIRDQARADAERAEGALDRVGPSITPQALKSFARTARKRMRAESGGYRRDHLRALATRPRARPQLGVDNHDCFDFDELPGQRESGDADQGTHRRLTGPERLHGINDEV